MLSDKHGNGSEPGKVAKIAKAIAANGPEAVKAAKALVQDYAGQPITDDLRADTAKRIAGRRVSDEGQARIKAFLERKK